MDSEGHTRFHHIVLVTSVTINIAVDYLAMVVDVTPSRKVADRSPRPSSAQIPPKSQLRSQVEHRLSLARAGSTV